MVIRESVGNGGFIAVFATGELMYVERWSWTSFSKVVKERCQSEESLAKVYTAGGKYIQSFGDKFRNNDFWWNYGVYNSLEDFERRSDLAAQDMSDHYFNH